MKKTMLYLFILISTSSLFSQLPTYEWAYSIGDVSQENLDALVIDSENNVIIGGQMYSTTDMDPTEFSEVLNQVGQQDAFIEKFPYDGSIVSWGVNFGGPAYDGIYKMAIDADDNIYAIGYYGYSAGVIDLNPDIVDQDLVTAHGGYDMFIVKFNKEGTFIWGHGLGAVQDDWINNITIDDENNIYVTGQFKGTVDFDGTEGVLEINSTLDKYDGFLAKYNSDGEIIWAFRIGGVDDDFANEVAVDHDGNIIVTGTFQGTGDFYGQLLEAADGTMAGWPKEGDAFVAKYNSDADLIWAKSIFGDDEFNGGYSNSVISLAVDQTNQIYITGLIYGAGDFDMNASEHILTSYGDYDSYFAKYTSDGDFVWVNTTAPKVLGYNLDMTIDGNNDIYLTGDFQYSAGIPFEADFDFNPDSIYALQGIGEKDVYIAKYDTDAELIWAYNIGGSGWDFATAIALDHAYNICVGGWFYNSDDFDANPDSNFIWLPYTIPSYGDNIWVGKYHQDGILPNAINELTASNQFLIYPNPSHHSLFLKDELQINHSKQSNINTIIIESINGIVMMDLPFSSEINISSLPNGVYFINIGNDIQKFMKY